MPVGSYKHARRMAARIAHYIFHRSGWRCHWCKMPIVRVADAAHKSHFKEEAFYVGYYDWKTGDIVRARKATIDHVVPLSDGGKSDASNLVAACAECNQKRNKDHQIRKGGGHVKVELAMSIEDPSDVLADNDYDSPPAVSLATVLSVIDAEVDKWTTLKSQFRAEHNMPQVINSGTKVTILKRVRESIIRAVESELSTFDRKRIG